MSVFRETLDKHAPQLTAEQKSLLENHWRLVDERARVMNLTAIREEREAAVKHYLDSLSVLPYLEGKRVLDVGSGAGYPGMPLALLRPQTSFTLLDATGKKCRFMSDCAAALKATNVAVYQGRAEELARRQEWRGRFDTVTARAVAALPTLCEYALPFLKTGGLFIAMKGPALAEELAAAFRALDELRGRVEQTITCELPDGDSRCLALIRKTGPTPAKYPRPAGKAEKMPL